MGQVRTWIAACALCAHGAFAQDALSDAIFADGFEFLHLSPVWLPDICDTPAIDDTFLSNTAIVLNTDVNCSGVVAQTDGPEICVVRANTITISGSMTVVGSRAVAFVADASLMTDGIIDVSAHGTQSGPGGGVRVSGGVPTSTNGGGGAGFATDGGAGGSATGPGAIGGSAVAPIDLAVFEGGPRAAPGAGFLDPDGGGGGGALLLIACRGSVTTRGTINAAGGGGAAVFDTIAGGQVDQSNSGGGGGGGGYVVIQGLTLDIGGGLFANGGGGGGGNSINDGAGSAGADGSPNTSPAAGGQGNGGGGKGGDGGAKAVAPTNGAASSFGVPGAGGGGSAGVLQLGTPIGVTPVVQPSTIASPDLAPFLEVQTKH